MDFSPVTDRAAGEFPPAPAVYLEDVCQDSMSSWTVDLDMRALADPVCCFNVPSMFHKGSSCASESSDDGVLNPDKDFKKLQSGGTRCGSSFTAELLSIRESQNRIEETMVNFSNLQKEVHAAVHDIQRSVSCLRMSNTDGDGVPSVATSLRRRDSVSPNAGARKSTATMRRTGLRVAVGAGDGTASLPSQRQSRIWSGESRAESHGSSSANSDESEVLVGVPTLPTHWPATVTLRDGINKRHLSGVVSTHFASNSVSLLQKQTSRELSPSTWRFCVLHPQSKVKVFLDVLSIVILIADLTLIPLVLAWEIAMEGSLFYFSTCTATFWGLDIAVNFVSGFYEDGGEVQMRPTIIAQRYIFGWFFLDVGIVFCDWLSMVSVITQGTNNTAEGFTLVRFAKVSRLLRAFALLRMIRLARISEDLLERYFSHEMRLSMRVVMILVGVIWVNHIISCLWFVIGRYFPTDTGTRWTNSEVTVGPNTYSYSGESKLYQYVTSMHWSIAQMTLGATDVNATSTPERIFSTAMLLVGLLFSSSLVSSLSATLIDLRMRLNAQGQILRALRLFLRQHDVDANVALRITKQVTQRIRQKEHLKEKDVSALGLVSASLRAELRYHMFKDPLNTHPLFSVVSSLNVSTAVDLCGNALEFVFLKLGDDLFSEGASCHHAYHVVTTGLNYVQDPDNSPVIERTETSIERGSWICEQALWTKWDHVGSSFADHECQLVVMSADVMIKALRKHCVLEEMVQCYAMIYCERVRTSKPPDAEWPNDLRVDFAEFGEIIVDMDPELQVGLSMKAFADISKPKLLRLFSDTESLRKQITDCRCALWINRKGLPERIVRVMVFKVKHLHDDSVLLVQVGDAAEDNGSIVPMIQLPGGRMEAGEDREDAFERIFHSKLKRLSSMVEVVGFHRETSIEESPTMKMRTRYVKSVCSMRMKTMLDEPVCEFRKDRKIVKASDSMLFEYMGTTHRSASMCSVEPESRRPDVFRLVGGVGYGLFAWMTSDEMQRIRHNSRDEVADWISNLDIKERLMRSRSAGNHQTQSRGKDGASCSSNM